MPRGKEKSRTKRRVKVRTPGARIKTHYKHRKSSHQKCGGCGRQLQGIPRVIPSKFRNLSKTKKRSSRPFSNLCSQCMRKKIIEGINTK